MADQEIILDSAKWAVDVAGESEVTNYCTFRWAMADRSMTAKQGFRERASRCCFRCDEEALTYSVHYQRGCCIQLVERRVSLGVIHETTRRKMVARLVAIVDVCFPRKT
jgi:hypothetical protein